MLRQIPGKASSPISPLKSRAGCRGTAIIDLPRKSGDGTRNRLELFRRGLLGADAVRMDSETTSVFDSSPKRVMRTSSPRTVVPRRFRMAWASGRHAASSGMTSGRMARRRLWDPTGSWRPRSGEPSMFTMHPAAWRKRWNHPRVRSMRSTRFGASPGSCPCSGASRARCCSLELVMAASTWRGSHLLRRHAKNETGSCQATGIGRGGAARAPESGGRGDRPGRPFRVGQYSRRRTHFPDDRRPPRSSG